MSEPREGYGRHNAYPAPNDARAVKSRKVCQQLIELWLCGIIRKTAHKGMSGMKNRECIIVTPMRSEELGVHGHDRYARNMRGYVPEDR